jgi:hypothetical protein
LEAGFRSKYPDADKVIYGKIINDLKGIDIAPDTGRAILKDMVLRKAALSLSERFFKVSQGIIPVDDAKAFYDAAFHEVDHATELPLKEVTDDIEAIIQNIHSKPGLRWRLDCLNKSLGSLRDGDFGFISVSADSVPTRPIVWFNNEEEGEKVMFRLYQAYFGITKEQLFANPAKYKTEFRARVRGGFRLFDSGTISRKDVERIVDELDPRVVIYDQLTQISGFSADRDDLTLGAKFQWARELAKSRHAAIGVSQASGMGEGVRYLTMDHVANAKTAVQAEADWILGIGCDHDETQPNARYLTICKNKLLGDSDSIPELRHGRFEVMIEPQIARYRDVIKFN